MTEDKASAASEPAQTLSDRDDPVSPTTGAPSGGDTPAEPPLLVPGREVHGFAFHADPKEYFRIWIVNTLLTLLTLGLFAAWAKVRKRRYLRGNTEFMGHRFDYRADPRRILVGNLLVAVVFVAYMVFGEVYQAIRIGAVIVGVILLPWIVVRSLAFNAVNTTYRGFRFYYHESIGMAALVYLGQILVIVVTLGLYYPAWVRNRKEFSIANHQLGDAFFRFSAKNGPFYSAYFIGGLVLTGASIAGGFGTALVLRGTGHKVADLMDLLPFLALYGTAFHLTKQYIYARLFNHVWNHTKLDEHRFMASLDAGRWLKLQLVNLGAIVLSCGLLYPWAVIRSSRYALSCLVLELATPLERIRRLGRGEGSALGETAGEFIGLDVGL